MNGQAEAGILIHHSLLLELHIGDQAEQRLPVHLHQVNRLLVGSRQQNLGPCPEPEHLEKLIGTHIIDNPLGLFKHSIVEQGQITGIVNLGVLHQQDHLHQSQLRIILHIHLILQVLHHGKEYTRIAVPYEKLVDITQGRIGLLEGRYLPVVVQQNIDGNIRKIASDPGRDLHGGHLVGPYHQNHHVEMTRVELLDGLIIGRNPGYPWHGGQVQLRILPQDMF